MLRFDPCERELAVDDVLGPPRLRAQGVVGGHAHITALGEVLEHRDALLALVPHHPGAAVEVQQHRRRGRRRRAAPCGRRRGGGPAGVVDVGDVADTLDASWPERQERHRPGGVSRAVQRHCRGVQAGTRPAPPRSAGGSGGRRRIAPRGRRSAIAASARPARPGAAREAARQARSRASAATTTSSQMQGRLAHDPARHEGQSRAHRAPRGAAERAEREDERDDADGEAAPSPCPNDIDGAQSGLSALGSPSPRSRQDPGRGGETVGHMRQSTGQSNTLAALVHLGGTGKYIQLGRHPDLAREPDHHRGDDRAVRGGDPAAVPRAPRRRQK